MIVFCVRHLLAPTFSGGFAILIYMSFTWGKRMRIMVIGVGVLLIVGALSAIVFVFMYKAPSCIDGVQNRDEAGIDCGGSGCSYLCTAQVSEPKVIFVRAFTLTSGRTDALAYVLNPNKQAEARTAPYTLELFGSDGTRITKTEGALDLPAGKTAVLFIPSLANSAQVTKAFITFDASRIQWQKTKGEYDVLSTEQIAVIEGGTPRITSVLRNDTFTAKYQVRVVATVFDAAGTAIAASATLVPTLAARSTVPLTFTWNEPFPSAADHIEVVPVLTLP